MLGEAITRMIVTLYQCGGVDINWLVALLAEHRLISRPLRLYLLQELVLSNHSLLN